MMTRCRLLFLLLSLSPAAHAQAPTPPAYRNFALEGGGVRGAADGGASQELGGRGVLAGIGRVGGTSAGAIQAALLAVGYSAQELVDVVSAPPRQPADWQRTIRNFLNFSPRIKRISAAQK